MKKYLLWDFHGTLVYPDTLWSINGYRAMREVLPNSEVSLADLRCHLDADGFPWQKPEKDYREYIGTVKWWENVGRAYLNTFVSCGIPEEKAKKILPLIRGKVLDLSNYRLFPDALDVLKALKERGFSHMILSNHLPELEDICEAMGLMEYVDIVVSSGNVGYEKPRVEIFEYGLNLIKGHKACCMIGDGETADVIGGRSAKLTTIKLSKSKQSSADYVCKTLTEIQKLVIKLYG